ncbi:MAG: flap endonuclease [Eubacterium sp.]|nr:flap endonuclease [Eubacterium sp.]
MNRLLIVDGSNLLFQMFFGVPARIVNKEGRAIQGTLGFVGALLKIIRMIKPTHVTVLFDGQHENARKSLDTNYKANRIDYSEVGEADNPFSQLPDVYRALDHLGIKHAEMTDCETDDAIAAYAFTYANDTEIIISSFDSDFFQLISENVTVLRYRGEKTVLCDEKYIADKFGITPAQYADFKSLTGDKADNIKGAEKIGVKTAAKLLNTFGTLDGIIAHRDEIAMHSVRESIIRNTERLKTNRQLIKLENDAAIPFEMEKLRYVYSGITTGEVLKEIGLK